MSKSNLPFRSKATRFAETTTNSTDMSKSNLPFRSKATTIMSPDNDKTERASLTATARNQMPFFRLPRKVRDQIYDLVALSEDTMYYNVTLRLKGGEQAQKTASTDRGAGPLYSDSRFETEYADAIKRRIAKLLIGADLDGVKLDVAAPQIRLGSRDVWLEVSNGELANGRLGRNLHALTFVLPLYIPVELKPHPNLPSKVVICIPRQKKKIIFTFNFPDRKELGSRHRLDLCWDMDGPPASRCLIFPTGSDSLVQQVFDVGKDVNWEGFAREAMLWQRYIRTYVR